MSFQQQIKIMSMAVLASSALAAGCASTENSSSIKNPNADNPYAPTDRSKPSSSDGSRRLFLVRGSRL